MDHSFDYENNLPEENGTVPNPAPENITPASDEAPETPAEIEVPSSEARFDPTPEQRSPYSDANYGSSDSAGAVPKSYYCSAPAAEKKKRREPSARRGMGPAAVIALCLVCALLGGLAAGFVPGLLRKDVVNAEHSPAFDIESSTTPIDNGGTVINKVSATPTPVTTNMVNPGNALSATEIYYNLALKQVVGVTTEITYTNYFGFSSSSAISGSGFIISADGYILTNHHVIKDAVAGNYEVSVVTYDGTKYVANVVGYEEDNDVAVLKIDGADFVAATIGDSDNMLVGETVYAVGNPLGELDYSMTDGIVSALDREIPTQDSSTGTITTINMFQISAAINSGNSGGPIYNSRGEVIGIATAKYSDTGIEGLGFGIPINDAIKIANDLISDGYVRGKAYLGVTAGTVTASAAQYYGLVEGAIISSVIPGSCAETAGLRENDIIVALGDTKITSRDTLNAAKKDYRAGDSAVIKIYRDGEYLDLSIVFDEETPEQLESSNEASTEPPQNPNTQVIPSEGMPSGGDYYDFFEYFFGGYPFGR